MQCVFGIIFIEFSRSLFCAYGSEIRRHNVSTGELVSVFDGHDDEVTDICISNKNQLQVPLTVNILSSFSTYICIDNSLGSE
jgi:WD40 repeat protein